MKLFHALLLPALLLTGCGPTFFSASGKLSNSGGSLDQWSETPVGCHRDVFDGDTSKLATFSWADPNANDPDREVHKKSRPAFPISLTIEKDGSGGYKGSLENSRAASILLSTATCKSFQFDTKERSKGFAESNPPLDGTLTLDCSPSGNHITGEVHFKHCE